jgi:hypothetical protein
VGFEMYRANLFTFENNDARLILHARGFDKYFQNQLPKVNTSVLIYPPLARLLTFGKRIYEWSSWLCRCVHICNPQMTVTAVGWY